MFLTLLFLLSVNIWLGIAAFISPSLVVRLVPFEFLLPWSLLAANTLKGKPQVKRSPCKTNLTTLEVHGLPYCLFYAYHTEKGRTCKLMQWTNIKGTITMEGPKIMAQRRKTTITKT